MEVKRGYKQTEVGVIPSEWEVERIGGIGNWFSGGTPSMANELFWNGEIPWVSAKDMKIVRLRDSILHVTEKAIGNGTRLAPPEALLMVVRGMILAHTFPVAVAMRPIAFNQDIKALTVRAGVVSEFILRWFQANAQRVLEIASESTHGTKRIPTGDLFSLKIALPSICEQEAIAGALSDADALIESLEQLVAKKRQVKQGAMQELLTGKKRLPGFKQDKQSFMQAKLGIVPDDWQPTCLEEVAAFITKGSTPTTYGFSWQNEGVLFLRSECVSERGLELSQSMFISDAAHQSFRRSEVAMGDILMTITGNVGRVVHLVSDLGPANINQHIARIRVNSERVVPLFVFHFLSQSIVRKYYNLITTGQAYPQISLKQVRETEVPLPSFAEQAAIAEILSDMDTDIAALEAKLDKARQIKQGMMQELLTGRSRLV